MTNGSEGRRYVDYYLLSRDSAVGKLKDTLERWRSEGIGPKFLKLYGRVIYRQVDIGEFEESCLATDLAPEKWSS
ncbi:hypothetical protein [Hydrogenophaga atypica]|uniref:DNA-binding protein n=1 Tax=Hydrogenophaga atypica TaxID=249409 RepID=A0ABW2QLR1_9BURK